MRILFVFITFLFVVSLGNAATILVPQDIPTIQGAIDAASDNDTVLVAPGLYLENIDFGAKNIALLSDSGRTVTTIIAEAVGSPVISIKEGQDSLSVIRGFGISGAEITQILWIQSSSPIIEQCEFFDGHSNGDGAAIYCRYSGAIIRENLFHDCSAALTGGAIFGYQCDGIEITSNIISGNFAYNGCGIGLIQNHSAVITRNVVFDNDAKSDYGGGIYVHGGNAMIVNNTITYNYKGITLYPAASNTVLSNIVAWNKNEAILADTSEITIDYNLHWMNGDDGYAGANGLYADPIFASVAADDYSLEPGSPAIDRGDPNPALNDPDGSRSDIGAIPFQLNAPIATEINLGSEDPLHVTNHTPTFHWSFFDTIGTLEGYEFEIGSDTNWTAAELWATGPVTSQDSTAVYSGLPLVDGVTYYYRIRLFNGSIWGSWKSGTFRMNSPPSVPTCLFPVDSQTVLSYGVYNSLLIPTDAERDPLTFESIISDDPSFSDTLFKSISYRGLADTAISRSVFVLAPNSVYYWKARAFDGLEYSEWTAVETFASVTPGTIHVPSDVATIQAAIDVAILGDTVLVAPGIYQENIQFRGNGAIVTVQDTAQSTILEPAADNLPVVTFAERADSLAVLAGFEIRNAVNASGIKCDWSSPLIIDCEIHSCSTATDGGGIILTNSFARIISCDIHDNFAQGYGGGIYLDDQRGAHINFCKIYENHSDHGSGIMNRSGRYYYLDLSYNQVYDNHGVGKEASGIMIIDGYVNCYNNTIVGNPNGLNYRSIWAGYIYNNIIVHNDSAGVISEYWQPFPYKCDVWENGYTDYVRWDNTCFKRDPLFEDEAARDFRLKVESPMIDLGHAFDDVLDADGTPRDLGALPYLFTLPIADSLHVPDNAIMRLTEHFPTFVWSYHDTDLTEPYSYELEISPTLFPFDSTFWSDSRTDWNGESVTYTGTGDQSLLDGSTYYGRIKLCNSGACGERKYFEFHMNEKPSVPEPLTPIDGNSVYHKSIQLAVDSSLNAESDTIRYEFMIHSVPDATDTVVYLTSQRSNFSNLIDSLELGRQYWWKARAFDLYEYSDWTAMQTFVTRNNSSYFVPQNYANIQAAVDIASSGDTVYVADGNYSGNGNRDLIFHNKAVVLKSVNGPGSTEIDCSGSAFDPHRAFYFPSYRDDGIVIDGFTIKNCYADTGGVTSGYSATVEFRNCIFTNNHAEYGGVSSGRLFSPDFYNCTFESNSAAWGGAIYILSAAKLHDCTFIHNSATYGGAISSLAQVELKNCRFYSNSASQTGSAIYGTGSSTFDSCIFVRNEAGSSCYALVCSYSGDYFNHCTFYDNRNTIYIEDAKPQFHNTLFAFNRGYLGICANPPIWDPDYPWDPNPDLFFCNLYGNDYMSSCFETELGRESNISLDPLFCDTANLDLTVAGASPCIGAGENGGNIGAGGVGCFPLSVEEVEGPETLPKEFALYNNYPNPFNPTTVIRFDLAKKEHVELDIINILGQRVIRLVNENLTAGRYTAEWDGTDSRGSEVASGVYFYRIQAGDFVKTKKMLMLK